MKTQEALMTELKAATDRRAGVRVDAVTLLSKRLVASKGRDRVALLACRAATTDLDYDARTDSLEALVEIGSRADRLRFEAALTDAEPVVRIIGAEGLAKMPSKGTERILSWALVEDDDPLVRAYAAEGLIGNRNALPILRRALEKEKDEVALTGILYAILDLGGSDVFQQFLNLITCDYYIVRFRVLRGLSDLAYEGRLDVAELGKAIEAVESLLEHEHLKSVRPNAIEALEDLVQARNRKA